MKPLYSKKEFDDAKSTDKLPITCYQCGKTFYIEKKMIKFGIENKLNINKYCSNKCRGNSCKKLVTIKCENCNIIIKKKLGQYKKTKHHFCSSSCAATYNNTHKKYGTRKSKLEVWLETKLTELYPDLDIHFNRKDAINSELDIYIPTLKLAFELNGLFHYEPIFGDDKLQKIQNNDNRKFQACLEQGIELCIIDSSQQKYFKEQTSIKFLNIIKNILKHQLLNNNSK